MASQDLADFARKVWERKGVTPDQLFGRMTPSQFVVLFGKPAGSGHFDRVEVLIGLNRERGRRGLRPVVPNWL